MPINQRQNKKHLEFMRGLEKLIEKDAADKKRIERARKKVDYPLLDSEIQNEVESHRDFVMALNYSLKIYCDIYCLKFEPLKPKYLSL